MEILHGVVEGEEEIVRRWPGSRRTVPRVRGEFAAVLGAWGLAKIEDTALLVMSELVTNAVQHARSPRGRLIETRWRRLARGAGVRIEVHDANEGLPVPRRAGEGDESGRGLVLVDALTGGQWGVSDRAGVGKLVWAVVAVPSDEAQWERKPPLE
jgi:serine/threonine-protein kinase RsbW